LKNAIPSHCILDSRTDKPEGVVFWAERGVGRIEDATDLEIFLAGAAWLRKQAKL